MVSFEKLTFGQRLGSMLKVDFKRMFKSRLFYILLACALVMPILMTVMMAMMDGSVTVDPQTGVESVMVGPENTWQNIGTLPGGEAMGGMDVFSMCNINMVFMLVAVFICLFISDDFRAGFSKNLFTVRVKKGDYVISKTLAGFLCGALMLILYFAGAVLGGAISGLSFDLHGLTAANLAMCILAKIFLMPVFISIFVLVSVAAKQKGLAFYLRQPGRRYASVYDGRYDHTLEFYGAECGFVPCRRHRVRLWVGHCQQCGSEEDQSGVINL